MSGHYSRCEYQFHYWALVGKCDVGDGTISIAVPLVIFNYPQKVTEGSVDFTLVDVEAMSEKTKDLALSKVDELESFIKSMEEEVGISTWSIVPTMTCHRHPGQMNLFSGTDYDMDLKNPGIVYPLNIGDAQPSFSSIICHNNGVAELVHTEFRIFNGNDEIKEYTYGKCMTYVKASKPDVTTIGTIMRAGIPEVNNSYILKDRMHGEGVELLSIIGNSFESIDYDINTSHVFEENVIKKTFRAEKNYTEYSYMDMFDDKPILTASRMKRDLIETGKYENKDLNLSYVALKKLHDEIEEVVLDFDDEDDAITLTTKDRMSILNRIVTFGTWSVLELDGLSDAELEYIDDEMSVYAR